MPIHPFMGGRPQPNELTMELQDRSDITQLMYRYADAMDRRDIAGVMNCFAASAETSWHGGTVRADGADELRRFLENAFSDDVLGATNPSSHLMANVMIGLEGDRANVKTTAIACLTNRSDTVTVRGIHYSDVCERGDDNRWRIRVRHHRATWEFSAPGKTMGMIAAPGSPT